MAELLRPVPGRIQSKQQCLKILAVTEDDGPKQLHALPLFEQICTRLCTIMNYLPAIQHLPPSGRRAFLQLVCFTAIDVETQRMCEMSTASHTRKQGHEDYGEACTHDNAWVCKCMQTFSFIKPEKNRPKPVTTHATHGNVLNMQGWQPHSTERRNPFVRGSPEHFLRASRAKEERRSRSCL